MIGFGKFSNMREEEIKSLQDQRLLKIDPTEEGFFDKVLSCSSDNQNIQDFIKAVREVKEEGVKPFWRPRMDPTIIDGKVLFKKGAEPAVGISYNKWAEIASGMAPVEGRRWNVGTEYQYYSFLVWLTKRLVEEMGWKIQRALNAVILDSKELGHYRNSENALGKREPTGRRSICGVFDLANTFKILRCSLKAGVLWLAGGYCINYSNFYPLAGLFHDFNIVSIDDDGVGWLVLE